MITIKEILLATNGHLLQGNHEYVCKGIVTDSRKIQKGECFIPLKGKRFDGHDFLNEACSQGTGAVVIERGKSKKLKSQKINFAIIEVEDTLKALGDIAKFWRNKFSIPLVAITGSNGKTTTKEMASDILSRSRNVLKTEGNFNNLIGVPLTLLRLEKGNDVAVVEMGLNQHGELGRLTEIANPQIGIVTNIKEAHLEGLGSIEEVAKAKAELIQRLGEKDTFIVNLDDPWVVSIAKNAATKKKITFGLKQGDIRVQDERPMGINGNELKLAVFGDPVFIRLKALGQHNVYNALAACAIASALNSSPEDIKNGLEQFLPFPMRSEIITLPSGISILNDVYNANPSSMEASLKLLIQLRGTGRTIAILGDMLELGKFSEDAHKSLGELIGKMGIDYLFLFGNYSECVKEGALKSGLSRERVFCLKNKIEIANEVKSIARPSDWILVKGSRGMKMEEVTNCFTTYYTH